jgi:predicted DNA-binding helix-hairpin-helix protein
MDIRRRFELLADEAGFEREHTVVDAPGRAGSPVGVTTVRVPGGGSTRLVRVMQTNACSLTCAYCPTFAGGRVRRVALASEEVVRIVMDLHRRGVADGLFLTSGVPGRAVRAMDRMLATLDLLRRREGFRGYVHVKLLPGAEPAQVDEAVRLASRVSVNLEAPADVYLSRLTPEKKLTTDLLPKLERAGRLVRALRRERRPDDPPRAGTTTQFVVGAAGEPDREILGVVARLERERLLHHAHFSAFQPVAGTPFEDRAAVPAVREARLYQAEHLLRDYGFRHDELVFDRTGNLPLDDDPKVAWALAHREQFPVALETAPPELLMRVPGIGPATARRLADARRRTLPRGPHDLRKLGIDARRAGYFLTLRGRRLAAAPAPAQLRLFPHGEHLTRAAFRTSVPPCAYR